MSLALLAALACSPIAVELGQEITPDETASPPVDDTGPAVGGGGDTDSGDWPGADSQPGETGDTGPGGETGETGETGDTGPPDTGVEVFDCSTAPELPEPATLLEGARAYHGVAFSDDGYLVGSDNQALIRTEYDGNWEIWVPGVGRMEQLAFLPDGDLIIASSQTGALERVTPEGGRSTVTGDLWAYGVIIGPDGMVYTAGYSGVIRVDPETGARELLGSPPNNDTPHSLNFSPDFSRLYLGVIASGFSSNVYAMPLDEDLMPAGAFEVFAEDVGGGWHDGVAVDACGNLYVPDYWSSSLYKITPAGEVSTYLSWADNSSHYGHGVVFGNGVGGWRSDALYLPMPYNGNTVQELVIGVPAAGWGGEVTGAR